MNLEGYCFKCKEKQEISDPVAIFHKNGSPATMGACPVCSTKIYKTGRTETHAVITPPEKVDRKLKAEAKRSGKLVIVESPAKAKTVSRFLGKGFTVRASVGHIRDLLRSELSVDVENNFTPKYRVPNEKRPVVKELKTLVKSAEMVYLATDPDREGEAIAWHLAEATEIPPGFSQRVVFHEITESAIHQAFDHPRDVNMNLVNAQQARRILDRLVGYNLSPLLWEKVRSRLSAGRVQSIALKLVVDREREIEAFIPVEYWTIEADFQQEGSSRVYRAFLARLDGNDPDLKDKTSAEQVLADVVTPVYRISKIKRGERKRKPSAPFTTSTLQQEASRRLGYTARRTMALAQQLYEGIDVGDGGATGLITYMRTDSTHVAIQAQNEARKFISGKHGVEYLPGDAPQYKTKAIGAQEAHEAIRPTSVFCEPDAIKKHLTGDQYKLYRLIWQRFVASQMESAVYDTISVDIEGSTHQHAYLFRTTGSILKFPGFLAVYEETQDEDKQADPHENMKIPPDLVEGAQQKIIELFPEQHFTQPPPRFTEATLVKAMEENGIGRPSTYAPIISTIQERGYVYREEKRLFPTETGFLVNDLLVAHFDELMDVNFTCHMEEDLDEVSEGKRAWVDVIKEFYGPFAILLAKAQAEMPVIKSEPEKVGRACPQCGLELIYRYGRYGKFISCSGFPACRYTEAILKEIGVDCPKDGGKLIERKTRKGRLFFGCANYPACDFTSWKKPIPQKCTNPECGNGLLVILNKRTAQCISCKKTYSLDEEQT
ncbi:MAG: type I DNA topoisomerase [Anaerolinea sp.]|nr:type I DNA topoisomerase [Anaerolinea sp.]